MRAKSKKKEKKQIARNLSLLLLEDSEDDAILLLRFLKDSNVNVHKYFICNSLDQFKTELASKQYDLIISDYNLAGFTGLDAFEIYSKVDDITPFIIVSGVIGEEVAVEAMRLGVHDYVMKDRMGRLIPALKRELNEAILRREKARISKELEVERNKFQLLVKNAPSAIYIINIDGRIEYYNNLAIELFGYDRDELTSLNDLIPKLFDDPDARNWVMDFYKKVFNPHQPLPDIEFPMLQTKTGSPKYIRVKTAPFTGQSFILMAEDITHQKLAAITLRENQKRLEKIFDTIQDIIIEVKVHNEDFIINNVNNSFCNSTGISRIDVIDRKIGDVLPNCENIESLLEKAVRQQRTINYDCQFEYSNQTRYWELFASPIFEDENTLSRIVISIRDWTERKQKEIALKISEEKFRIISELASDAIWEWDIPSDFFAWNDGFQKMLGYGKEDIEPTIEWILGKVHYADVGKLNSLRKSAFQNKKKTWTAQIRMECKDGSFKDVVVNSFIYYNDNGQPVRTVGAIVDHSHRLKAEELRIKALVEGADNERGSIARELHDNIGQKLTFISMLLDQSTKNNNVVLVEKAYKILNETIEGTRSMSHLLMPKTVDEYGIKAAILSQLETLKIGSKYEIQTHFNFGDERFATKIENNLYSIFQEIIANIIKHAQAHMIHIQMEKVEKRISLSVEDDGVGFDINQHDYQPGLGLRNIENRAYLLKGSLDVESVPGNGTFIHVEVPLE